MKLKLTILGGGESGVGAALLGVQKGYDVFLSDSGVLQETYKTVLERQNIAYEAGQHSETRIAGSATPELMGLCQKLCQVCVPAHVASWRRIDQAVQALTL